MATDSAGRLLNVVDKQEAALGDAAETASKYATADLREAIAAVVARALAALDRGESFDKIMQQVRAELLALPISLVNPTVLADAFQEAFDMGIENGREQEDEKVKANTRTPRELQQLAELAPQLAMNRLAEVARDLAVPVSAAGLAAQLARANAAVSSVERSVAVGTAQGAALGVERVALKTGAEKLWLPERDACLHCLKYAGLHVPAGESFPGGLTFDRKPLSTADVPNPPLHPFCRCRLALYRPETERKGEVSLPDALKREATRSVARGFSLPTESETRRIEAAERLLRKGVNLPESVKAYAKKAIDKGEFPRGRNVPQGTLRP